MSRDLDETIQYHKGIADKYESRAKCHSRPQPGVYGSGRSYLRLMECAREHRQLVEWLTKLKKYEDGINQIIDKIDEAQWCGWNEQAQGLRYALKLLGVEE